MLFYKKVDNIVDSNNKEDFMNIRSIGKFGFLLAIIGFFMPVACDKNAFQLIEYVDSSAATLIIVMFVLACIGLLIGVILLVGKNIPIFIDWIILLGCIGVGIGLLSKNDLELQYGAYVIGSGFGVVLLAQIISIIKKET
jgi:hypothetical protein